MNRFFTVLLTAPLAASPVLAQVQPSAPVPSKSYVDGQVQGLNTAIGAKAPLASPAFTGTPTAPALSLTGPGLSGPIDNATVSGMSLPTVLGSKAPLASPAFTGTVSAPTIQIQGTGSTGDASVMGVAPTGQGGSPKSLADLLSTTIIARAYGVKCDGTTDDTVKAQQALDAIPAAGGEIIFPEGTCIFGTAYASGLESRAIGPHNLSVQNRSNVRIRGSSKGTTFTTSGQGNYSHILFIFQAANIDVSNINFVGNNTGVGAGLNNGALFLYSVRDFRVADISTSVFQGSHIVGNFQINGVYERIRQNVPVSASCYDISSWQNVTIRDLVAVGPGNGAAGQCFQHSYDAPNANQAFNQTGIPLRESVGNNVTLDHVDISAFHTGIVAYYIKDFTLQNSNIHDNIASTGAPDYIYGMLVWPQQAGFNQTGIRILNNTFRNNGSVGNTGGATGAIGLNGTGGALVAEVRGNRFIDNRPTAIVPAGDPVTLMAHDNDFGSTTYQTTTVSRQFALTTAPFPAFTSRITGNLGLNPVGWTGKVSDPGAPTALGVANGRVNNNPYPLTVYMRGHAGTYVVAANGSVSPNLDAPSFVILQPQDKIYFDTTLPNYWATYGG